MVYLTCLAFASADTRVPFMQTREKYSAAWTSRPWQITASKGHRTLTYTEVSSLENIKRHDGRTSQHPLRENQACRQISTHMFSKVVARKQMAFPGDVQHWAVVLAKCFSCQTRIGGRRTRLSELEHMQQYE